MASNEHRNLQDPNIHNPTGFGNARNSTVLSKGSGSGNLNGDGLIDWCPKKALGTTNYPMKGFLTGTTNYQYAITQGPLANLLDRDFGSPTVVGQRNLLSNKILVSISQSYNIPYISKATAIKGYLESTSTNPITIAICKATPSSTSVLATLAVIDEFDVNGGGTNVLVPFSETTITQSSLAEGDILFVMVKETIEGDRGSEIIFNLTVETISSEVY